MKQIFFYSLIIFTQCFAMQKTVGINSLVQSSNKFAFTFYEMNLFDNDFIYSPFSIYSSMIMAYLGAEKQTAKEIKNALNIKIPKEIIAQTYHNWSRGVFKKKQECEFFIANGIWVEKTTPILPEYSNVLLEEFHADAQAMNFHYYPKNERENINLWIADNTQFKIENLLTENDVTADAKIILASAVVFQGNWEVSFNEALTIPSPFYIDQGQMYAEMMHQIGDFLFYETDLFKAVLLPFKCEKMSNKICLIILLPKDSHLNMDLNLNIYNEILNNIKKKTVDLKLPKFTIDSNYNLNQFFQKIGVNIPFSRLANFSGINGRLDLYLSSVLHGSYISIDEYGSSTSAATASKINTNPAKQRSDVKFYVDRPFYFFLCEMNSQSLFFLGKCVNPKRARS